MYFDVRLNLPAIGTAPYIGSDYVSEATNSHLVVQGIWAFKSIPIAR